MIGLWVVQPQYEAHIRSHPRYDRKSRVLQRGKRVMDVFQVVFMSVDVILELCFDLHLQAPTSQ